MASGSSERGNAPSVGLYDVPYLNKSEGAPAGGWQVESYSTINYHNSNTQFSNTSSPVGGWQVEQYPTDAVVRTYGFGSSKREPPKRGKVKEFSYRSRRRLLFCAFNASCDWRAFVGLTYPAEFPMDGQVLQEHLHHLLVELKRVHGVGHHLWAREFQERGAGHFHALFDEFIPKDWLSRRWFEIVGSGDEKHLAAGTSIERCINRAEGASYMAKVYGAKYEQKEPPAGFVNLGRYWGSSRGLVQPDQVVELTEQEFKGMKRVMRHIIEKRAGKRIGFLHDKQGAGRGATLWRGRPIVGRLLESEVE